MKLLMPESSTSPSNFKDLKLTPCMKLNFDKNTEMAYRNPHVFYEELRELRVTIQGLRKFGEETKHWKLKYNEKVEYLNQEEAFSLYAQVIVGKWFIKCEQLLKLSNHLIHVFSKRIKHDDDEMTYENIPNVVSHFILFCQDTFYTLREELKHLKNFRGVTK